MKPHCRGTAAAEGMPAIFCRCKNCVRARELGGRILIDPNPDTFANSLRYGFSLIEVRHVLVTHAHIDHFYPDQLAMIATTVSRGS